MSKIYRLFLLIVFSLFFLHNNNAQIVDVCGSDTIVLRTGNYHYGTIQWESSYDNINWEAINGANDTVYKFYPGETKYYRAVALFFDCPPVSSIVSLVQVTPVSNAGSNRTINGTSTYMMANKITGAQGTWSVISGSGGTFADVHDPYTEFQGTDSLYKLVWTLSNACGTSKDTITVQFKQNVYIDAIVIVDSTDVMLSDSAQLAQGIYIIQFSSPQPTITDSTVLIGLINEGFIRKVDSFSVQTNTHTIYTSQGTLEDITVSGVYDVAQVFDVDTAVSVSSKSTNLTRLDHLPTRAELLSDPKYKTGRFYYVVENEPVYLHPGVSLNSTKEGGNLIDINFNNSIFNSGGSSLALSGYYKFNPNLIADFDYGWFKVKYFNIGMNNGVIEQNIQLAFDASGSTTVLDKNFTIFSASKNIIMILGLVPVWVQAKISLDGKASLEANASMNITHGYTKTTTLNASIDYQNGSWSYNYDEDSKTETTNQILVSGDMTQNFDIGPRISFKIYGIVGPEVDVRLTEELKLCFKNTNWKADLNLGGDLTMGTKAEVFGKSLFDVSKTWSQGFYTLSLPDKLQGISGNNQHYNLGDTLAKKTRVRVRSSKGTPVPGVVVKFQPKSGGTVADSLVISDLQGYAETVWTPGGATESKMEAYVWECDSSHINNSPIVFTAIANQVTPTPDCSQSSLSVSITNTGSAISPVAAMGNPPYTYSIDGVNFLSQIPSITFAGGVTYTFTVRDDNGCEASASFTAPPDPCLQNTLTAQVLVIGNVAEVFASGGTPPYLYALNNIGGNYTSNNSFTGLFLGNYTVFVKDANACIISKPFSITDTIVPIYADFSATPVSVMDGNDVHFYDLSNNATSWLWDFGDGQTSTLKNPVNTYTGEGLYTVTLTATNTYGSHTKVKTDFIEVTPDLKPNVSFVASKTSLIVTDSVVFTDLSSNTPTSWKWYFGDGDSSSLQNPVHFYPPGTYNVTLKATNSYGTNQKTVTNYIVVAPGVPCTGMAEISDVDGNYYGTVQIGTQCWMRENLKTTKYRNGDIIGTTNPPTLNTSTDTVPQKYQWPARGNEAFVPVYGRLYTWYTINDNRGVCPVGWHVPTGNDWQILYDYLLANGFNYDGSTTGNKLAKALSAPYQWWENDGGLGAPGTPTYLSKMNASGFTAIPAGMRRSVYSLGFEVNDWTAYFWSIGGGVKKIDHGYWYITMDQNVDAIDGISVRCVKD